jgi:hypothetical protein
MSIIKANNILINHFSDSLTIWEVQLLIVAMDEKGVSLIDFVNEYGGVLRTGQRRLKLLVEADVVDLVEHPTDYRRKLIVLPESTSKVMKAYLKELSKS